jgi:hypothetical protein
MPFVPEEPSSVAITGLIPEGSKWLGYIRDEVLSPISSVTDLPVVTACSARAINGAMPIPPATRSRFRDEG